MSGQPLSLQSHFQHLFQSSSQQNTTNCQILISYFLLTPQNSIKKMNFFKSVFADDPSSNLTQTPNDTNNDDNSCPNSNPTNPSQSWSFDGLIKTLQVKSNWIETYQKDLKEFGAGLKKETEVLCEVAGKTVKDLPTSNPQFSLGSIGSSVWKSTAQILNHGKESLLDYDNANNVKSFDFDAQLCALQCDVRTYVEDPDDFVEYNEWKNGFDLEGKSEEIEGLMEGVGSVGDVYRRLVPNVVEHEVFWCRYYYWVYRLEQAESVKARLVKRNILMDDEKELSWNVDDDDDDEGKGKVDDGLGVNAWHVAGNYGEEKKLEGGKVDEGSCVESSVYADERADIRGMVEVKESNVIESANEEVSIEEVESMLVDGSCIESSVSSDQRAEISGKVEDEEESNVVGAENEVVFNKEVRSQGNSEVDDEQMCKKSEEKGASHGKIGPSGSCKDSDVSVVSTKALVEEEDLDWDEMEDISSGDEKKVSSSEGFNRDELRKRLSAADEDTDLGWDIEDDD